MMPWSMLQILAWSLGVKAVRDLRAEFDPLSKSWFFLSGGVRLCLAMQIAMLGAGRAAGLALVSALASLLAAFLLWEGFRTFQEDIRKGGTSLLRRNWDLAAAWLFAGATGFCVLAGVFFAQPIRRFAALLHPAEGAAWLITSAWLSLSLASFAGPKEADDIYAPRAFSLAFFFAFLNSCLGLAPALHIAVPPEAGALIETLFALTLTISLYGAGIRFKSHKLLQAMAQINEFQERLFETERISAVGTIAAGAAHDFNNSLTSILGLTEFLLNNPTLPEPVREDVEGIKASAQTAAVTTSGLLSVVRNQRARCNYLNLRDAVGKPLEILERDFAKKGISIVKRFGDVPKTPADLCLVSQVCLNLYLNARDAMKPKGGGILTVSLQAASEGVLVTVEDTGAGIPEDFQAKVFKPFQTTKGEKGTGLGLAASRSMIESIGGAMGFETSEGKGTTFWIRLPTGHKPSDAL